MPFHSIRCEKTEESIKEEAIEAPSFFTDLNLDQIIDVPSGNLVFGVCQQSDIVSSNHSMIV